MEHKFEENPIKNKDELLEEFKKHMSRLGYISELTGAILTDPIIIAGSSDPVERHFVQESVRITGRNPFNRQPMTLIQVNNIATAVAVKNEIENEINKFLNENKDRPDYKDLMQAVNKERYAYEAPSPTSTQTNQPAAPTPDDVLAMQQAVGAQAFQAQQPQAPQFFEAPAQQPASRLQRINWGTWELWHYLGEKKIYYNSNPSYISEMQIKNNPENCTLWITATYMEGDTFRSAIAHNRLFKEALQNHGITADLPGIGLFPGDEDDIFYLTTSPEELAQLLPQILNALQEIEPSISDIIEDVMNTFPERHPGP